MEREDIECPDCGTWITIEFYSFEIGNTVERRCGNCGALITFDVEVYYKFNFRVEDHKPKEEVSENEIANVEEAQVVKFIGSL